MSKCLKREILQAFADGELHESVANSAQLHLASCASCAAELENIRATNLQTNSLSQFTRSRSNSRTGARRSNSIHSRIRRKPQTNDRRNNRGNRSVRAARLHASAAQRAARKSRSPIPISANSSTPANAASASQQVASLAPPQEISKSPSVRMPTHSSHAAHKPPIRPVSSGALEFIPLDDDGPIESGTIVRVNLNVSSQKNAHRTRVSDQVPVDVLVDEQGQVVLIRFLDGGAK